MPTGRTLQGTAGQCLGPSQRWAGAPGGPAPSPEGVVSLMPAEQGGSQTPGPVVGRAQSSSPGAVEAGRELGPEEDLHPLPRDTVSTGRLAWAGGAGLSPEKPGRGCWWSGRPAAARGLWGHQRLPCFSEPFSVASSHGLFGAKAPPGPGSPRRLPAAASMGSFSCGREVLLLLWASDQPQVLAGTLSPGWLALGLCAANYPEKQPHLFHS